MFENKRVRRIFGSRGEETIEEWRILRGNDEIHMLNVIESIGIRLARHVTRMHRNVNCKT
jgi:hypothetical protein